MICEYIAFYHNERYRDAVPSQGAQGLSQKTLQLESIRSNGHRSHGLQ